RSGGTVARKLKSEDLYGLKFVSAPQLAPDGTRAACVVTSIEQDGGAGSAATQLPASAKASAKKAAKADTRAPGDKEGFTPPRYRSRIHLFDLPPRGPRAVAVDEVTRPERTWTKVAGSGGSEFTRGEYRDFAPRFSPDGTKLAFL